MVCLKMILIAVIGYLLGCIPVGVVIAKRYANTDIRATGSGNTGTTNVLRTLGWLPSVMTLAGDCVKGLLGALIGKYLGGQAGMLLGGLCSVLGHDFPVFARFKGGKGVATSLGVTIVVAPMTVPWLLILVLGIVALIRMMSVGSLAATVVYPILFYYMSPEGADLRLYMAFAIIMALLCAFCHRTNIMRLLKGEENKLDFGKINRISKKFMQKHREKRERKQQR